MYAKHVKPKEGFKIFDPTRRDFIEPEGRDVTGDELYWDRLARDEDVTLTEVKAPVDAPVETKASRKSASSSAE